MPELPEVEVTRIGLADRLRGARVRAVHVGASLRWPLGVAVRSLHDMEIGDLVRRGKYIWMPLAAGRRSGGLLWHLGMSGSLRLHEHAPPPRGRHDHFELVSSAGTLRLTDPRRFGAVLWHAGDPARHPLLAGLGVEPLSPAFTGARLHAATRGRRAAIKHTLMDHKLVVGIGNIYANEALFRARIHPRAPAGRLSLARCERLVEAVRSTLRDALAAGGSTLRDFVHSDGAPGYFQQRYDVYDREGAPCRICALPVRRIAQGQRSTWYCPGCQPR